MGETNGTDIYGYSPLPGQHTLPALAYGLNALSPVIDSETLRIHHDVLHRGYVDNLNKTELEAAAARRAGDFSAVNLLENNLAFYGSGHILHSVYWAIMTAIGSGGVPGQATLAAINGYFGSFNGFKAQFMECAKGVQGSGWAILGYQPSFGRLELLQCLKHQNLTQWGIMPILVCDVWEHAYYLQYTSRRADFIEAWWQLIDWYQVEKRLILARTGNVPLVKV